jgi:cysteine desulfurase
MSAVPRLYLDYNATAPLRPEAIAAMQAALALPGNPSSVHQEGRAARRRVDAARRAVAALVNVAPGDVIFTSGGTEANNLAIFGARPQTIIASAVEHDAVLAAAHSWGATVRLLRVGRDGALDLAQLRDLLAQAEAPVLVSVMLANNETGVIFPVAEVARIAHEFGALVHCDAVQAAGKIAIDAAALGVDLLTLSAHKIGGPQGVGALFAAAHLDLDPVQRGGGQERGLRAGTENVAGICGFGAAAEAALAALPEVRRIEDIRREVERQVRAIQPAAIIYGEAAPRLPNTICIGLPGMSAETQVMALDLAGIAVSAGAACSSGKMRPSHVLAAMGFDDAAARSAIRVSLGWGSDEGDGARFIAAWTPLALRAASRSAA